MSLTSLARNDLLQREQTRVRVLHRPRVLEYTSHTIAPKYHLALDSVPALAEDLLPLTTAQAEEAQTSNALDSLVKYIPTESITLYVAAASAMEALKTVFSGITTEAVYWFFGVLTPVLFLLIYAGKRRSANLSPLPALKDWPWWKLVASTIAFLVWALAVPTSPYLSGAAGGAVAALAALFVSTFLSLFEPIFDRPAS
jgi:hypothetical protein